MTIAKEAVYALHQRLKDLSINAPADQLAYLAKALESIAGQSSVYDIVNMSDEKLQELLDAATSHLADLDASKVNSLAAIDTAKTGSLDAINTLKTSSLSSLQTATTGHLSLLDTRKDTNITAIESTGQTQLQTLTGLVSNFESINDVPNGSSIMNEVAKRNMIESGSLPFLFGILSRQNDYWGYGDLTSQLGVWYNNVSNADNMLQLLAGTHGHSTNYAGFYRPPQLYFLQGTNGMFIHKEMYVKYSVSSNEYTYPYAALGVIFVKNTTNADITRTFYCGGSSYWSSGYEGLGVFVCTPNNVNANKSAISGVTWTNIYNYAASTANIAASANVLIPAGKTVAILLYSSSYYYTAYYNYYTQFMHWYIYNFKSSFLTTELEVDVDRTLRAWQCRGLQYSYELWKCGLIMPIYLRFENGMQVETTTLPKKPEGTGWYKAPTEFDWEKRYKLLEDNTVAECSADEMQGDLLKNAKLAATESVRFILNNHRRSFAGYSHEKSRSYDIQEKTAKSIVAAVKNNQTPDEKDVELIAPLAELRSISVEDMAQLILTKSRKADRAIARCENIEDRAQRKIESCTTLDELKTFMDGFEKDVETNLSKL